jgi:hypothetical protein
MKQNGHKSTKDDKKFKKPHPPPAKPIRKVTKHIPPYVPKAPLLRQRLNTPVTSHFPQYNPTTPSSTKTPTPNANRYHKQNNDNANAQIWTTQEWNTLIFEPLRTAIKSNKYGPQLKLIAMLPALINYPHITIPTDIQQILVSRGIGPRQIDILTFLYYDLAGAASILVKTLPPFVTAAILSNVHTRSNTNQSPNNEM